MMKKTFVLAIFAGFAAAQPVAAHDAFAPHAHPHADWGHMLLTLLAFAALAAAVIIPLGANARARSKRRDSR